MIRWASYSEQMKKDTSYTQGKLKPNTCSDSIPSVSLSAKLIKSEHHFPKQIHVLASYDSHTAYDSSNTQKNACMEEQSVDVEWFPFPPKIVGKKESHDKLTLNTKGASNEFKKLLDANAKESDTTTRTPNSRYRNLSSNEIKSVGDYPPTKKVKATNKDKSSAYGVTKFTPIHQHVTYVCLKCQYATATDADLCNHPRDVIETVLRERISTTNDIQCPHCSHAFGSKQQADLHVIKHRGDRLHLCLCCTFRTPIESVMQSHMVSRHKNKPDFKCPHCGQPSLNSIDLHDHIINDHSDPRKVPCLRCKFYAASATAVARHSKSHMRYHAD